MTSKAKCLLGLFIAALVCLPLDAQSVRDHTRLKREGPKVSDAQATDLTLTLNQVTVRPIQVWVRTAGRIDKGLKVLTAYLSPAEAGLVKVGQRVRAFPPESKSSMFQAYVTKIAAQGNRTIAEITLTGVGRQDSTNYVMEIVADRGEFLSIPNEAIIEEGDKRVVYVQQEPGRYEPREVQTGIQGELYTAVEAGLKEGDEVVSFGSFFIDSEYKLKFSAPTPTNDQ